MSKIDAATSSTTISTETMQPTALERVQQVLRQESDAIAHLADHIADQSEDLATIVELIYACSGRIILTGVGKAGLIARKISATMSSTGTPTSFMHPTEAHHGDLGMITDQDVVLALSHSGSSQELIDLIPHIKRIGAPLVAMVGKVASPLAEHADHRLHIGELPEACPLGLAPSTSTSVLLALGDALSFAVLDRRGFKREDYARFHPAGALGRKLMTVADTMRTNGRLAIVHGNDIIRDVLPTISRARAGSALLVNDQQQLVGLFSDGDLRRALSEHDADIVLRSTVQQFATIPCRSIHGSALLAEALHQCNQHQIDELPVTDDTGHLIGLIDLQDLTERGFDIT